MKDRIAMKVSGIDVGKFKHIFSILDKESGEILVGPIFFNNDKEEFQHLVKKLELYPKDELFIGMEDTGIITSIY